MRTNSSALYPYTCGCVLFLAVTLAASLQLPSVQAQQPTVPILSHTPTITLTLGTPAKGSVAARLAKLNALAGGDVPTTPGLLQPQSRNGVFDEISLGCLNGNATPAPASVTLQFDASNAGASVWIQPLDGGAILTQDADGNPVSNPAGCAVTLNSSGELAFRYQALALAGRYQVLVRLGATTSILPFVILDPSQDN